VLHSHPTDRTAPMTMRDLNHANRLVQAIVEAIVMT
jgi:hypothetical protein